MFILLAKFYKTVDNKYIFIINDKHVEYYNKCIEIFNLISNSNYENKKIIFKHYKTNSYFIHICNEDEKYLNLKYFNYYWIKLELIDQDNHLYFVLKEQPVLFIDPNNEKKVIL